MRGTTRRQTGGATWRCAALALLLLVITALHSPVRAQNDDEVAIAVVVGAGASAQAAPLSSAMVASIFRRKRQFWDDQMRIVAVNLPALHPLRRQFSQRLFKRSPEDLQAYWNDQYFHGVVPPAVLASEEAVIRFVADTPGAVGYVWACSVDKRVAVVALIGNPLASAPCPR
jgi:ABC-type phosphate transport system substrate-binding protein